MDEIKNQVPDNISDDTILDYYLKNNSNVVSTIMALWDLKEDVKELTSEQKKWKEIRETCDLFDNEMYNTIRNPPKADCDPPKADCNPPKADCDPPKADCDPIETDDDNIEADIKG